MTLDTLCLSPSILKVRTTAPPWQRGSWESRVCDEPCEGWGLCSPSCLTPPGTSTGKPRSIPRKDPACSPSRQPLCYHWSPCHPVLLRWCKSLLPGLPTSVQPFSSAALSVARGSFKKQVNYYLFWAQNPPDPFPLRVKAKSICWPFTSLISSSDLLIDPRPPALWPFSEYTGLLPQGLCMSRPLSRPLFPVSPHLISSSPLVLTWVSHTW